MARAVRHVLLAMILATISVAVTPAAGEPEVAGVYIASGLNPDGSEYRGFVHIARLGESVVVRWIFPQILSEETIVLAPSSVGIGIVSNGMLAVSYYGEHTAGVVIYRFEEDGTRMTGRWTVVGDGGAVHAETLTRLPERAPQLDDAGPSLHRVPPRDQAPQQRVPARPPTARSL